MLRKLWRKFITDQEGGPAIEFALVGGFIAVCLPAILDLTALINSNLKLSNGMRAGAQYALKYSSDNTGIAQAIASASNLSAEDLTVSTSQFCECNGSSNSCSVNCTGGFQLAKYVNVTATYNISYQYNYEAMPYPLTLSKTTAVRIQ